MKVEQQYKSLVDRLAKLRRREKKFSLLRGLLIGFLIIVVLSVLSTLFESLFRFSSPIRTVLAVFSLLTLFFSLIWFVIKPLILMALKQKKPDDIVLALKVGKFHSQIKDRLADALQVYRESCRGTGSHSRELANASLESIFSETKNINFCDVADRQKVIRWLKPVAGFTVLCVVVFALFPVTLQDAAFRLSHPFREFNAGPVVTIKVAPGNYQAVKGDDVPIKAFVSGLEGSEIGLFLKKTSAERFEEIKLASSDQNQFVYTIPAIKEETEYYFRKGKQQTETYAISVVERPFVRSLQASISFPEYSKLGTQYLDENVGDISALRGSKVTLKLLSNKPVSDASIRFNDGKNVSLKHSGQELSGQFVLNKSGSYQIFLQDQLHLTNDSPINYRIETIADQIPFVQIAFPGRDVDLGKDMILPLSIEAQDDFGFSQLRLRFQVLSGGFEAKEEQVLQLPLPSPSADQILVNHNWSLGGYGLSPGDVVSYFAEVFDNDDVSGPKSAKSEEYRVRLPSMNEIFDEVAESQDETYDELKSLVEESKSLKATLDNAVQQMKRNPDLNWEEKQKIQDAVQAQEKVQEKVQELQNKLDEMVNRLEQNDLLSQETLDKYRELQQLMQELLTEDLKKALAELQKSMDQLNPQKLQEAVKKLSESQEDFLKGMERTVNLLKKLQIEQKMDEMVRKAQELVRRQEALNKQAGESQNTKKSEKYAKDQEGIKQDTKSLEKDLTKLSKQMGEFPQMPQEDMQKAKEQAGAQLQEQMQQAANQFQSGDMQNAQQSGQQISQNLKQMLQSLQSAKEQMTEKEKQKLMQAFKRSSNDLLNLSKRQEALMKKTEGTDRNTPGMTELADEQENLLSGLSRVTNQLYDLSQETFFITPQIGQALGKSISGMQKALQQYEARNSSRTTRNQAQAMGGLNEAVSQLHNSMQSMSGASSGIGFQEMMQQLMGISGKQKSLNQQTSELGQKPGMSMEQGAAMQRLAAQQEALRKSLEQLNKEYKNRSEILGDLEKVGNEMADVVNDLMRKNVNRKTIDRQKNILSRLLDAQKSMHSRDFSNKRRAKTGKQVQALSPGALPDFGRTESIRLKSELLKALKEGYSKDYRELIQKYFDALAKEQAQGTLSN